MSPLTVVVSPHIPGPRISHPTSTVPEAVVPTEFEASDTRVGALDLPPASFLTLSPSLG